METSRFNLRSRKFNPAKLGVVLLVVGVASCATVSPQPSSETPPAASAATAETTYRVYVANESSDLVSRVAFNAQSGAWVEKAIPVGLMPSDNDGAHGIAMSADGQHWYLTLAHGSPNGQLWTFQTGTDSLVARTELGLFPATMGVTPDGTF